MRTIIIATLLFLTSVNGVAAAAKEVDIIEIEAEGSYRMGADTSVVLARKVALFTAKRQAVNLAGRYLYLFKQSGEKIPELGQHLYGEGHNILYFA